MKKFKLNCRKTWFRYWFLAIACQSGYCLSQGYVANEEQPLLTIDWPDENLTKFNQVADNYSREEQLTSFSAYQNDAGIKILLLFL